MTNYEQIFQKLGEISGTLDAVLEQTKKTNGRVTALEARATASEIARAEEKGEVIGQASREKRFSNSRKFALTILSVLTALIALIYKIYNH